MPGLTTREFALPAVGDGFKNKSAMDGYSVKYGKFDMDDLEDISLLQDIETRGLQGEDIVLVEKDKFTFMSSYFIILKYLEKNPE